MALNLLENQKNSRPVNLLAEEQTPEPKESKTAYLEDRDEVVSYPAGMPLDRVNQLLQKTIYNKAGLGEMSLALEAGGMAGKKVAQEKGLTEVLKAIPRGFTRLGESVGTLTTWMGDLSTNSADKDFAFEHINASLVRDFEVQKKPEEFANFQRNVGGKVAKWGVGIAEYFEQFSAEGALLEKDAEIFAGSFIDNPSWTRGAALIAEAIPSLAAATAVTFATGSPLAGATMLGLLEGSGTYEEGREAGKTVDEATGLGVTAVVGLTILETIPLTRFLRGGGKGKGIAKLTKDIFIGTTQEGGEEVAQQLLQNMIAKIGWNDTRDLWEGTLESFIAGAGSGGFMGGITSGRGRQVDRLVKEALEKGVTEAEIEQMRDAVRNSVIDKKDEINTVLEKSAQKVKKVNEEAAIREDFTPLEKQALKFDKVSDFIKSEPKIEGDVIKNEEELKEIFKLVKQKSVKKAELAEADKQKGDIIRETFPKLAKAAKEFTTAEQFFEARNKGKELIEPKQRPTILEGDIEGIAEGGVKVGEVKLDNKEVVEFIDKDGQIVAVIKGKEVGFASELENGEIDLTVTKENQRKGIGKELIKQFLEKNPKLILSQGSFTEAGKRNFIAATRDLFAETKASKEVSAEVSTEALENRKLSKQTLKKKNTVGKQVIAGIDKVLSPISTRLRQISPKLSAKLTRFEFESRQSVLQDEKAITPFLEGVKAMPAEDQADLDFAFKNGNAAAAGAILEKHGLTEAYAEVRKTLNRLYKDAGNAGYEVGYIKDFMPRKVRDFEGLREYFQKEHSDIWSDMLLAIDVKEMELGYKLSTQDQAAMINSLLRGFGTKQLKLSKPGALKGRKVDYITPEINQFYYPISHSLLNYVYAVNDGIAARKFFGRSFKGAAAGENPNIQDSIGAFVLDALIAREISPLQEQELKDILNARFQPRGPGNIIGGLKNLSYISTMGNVISAITQIGDLAFSMYNSGVLTTTGTLIEALTGNSRVTKEDIGIEKIATEFEEGGKTRSWLEATFRMTGLTWMDRIGKQTLINAAFKTYKNQVQKDTLTPEFKKRLDDIFGDEAESVIDDLRNDRVTENVKMLLFSDLSRFQPITLSEMPETYLTSGNGRVFYMLKTYTIKQIDVFRNEVFLNPNKKEAFSNFIRLTFALVLMNATADVIKDFILGRPFEPEDTLIDNILRLMGFSKFQVYTARQEGIGRAFLKGILIPPLEPINILDNMYMDIKRAVKEGEINLNELDTIQRIPFAGKLYYWWFGRGRSKTEKKIAKKSKERKFKR